MSVRKASAQELQAQIKEIRGQLQDQLKCLENRTDVQVNIYHEVNDFCKKRAELDQEYVKQLDKLAKSAMLKYKNEKNKRAAWTMYSGCTLFMQLVDDTKEEARHRGIVAEVLGNLTNQSFASNTTHIQRVSEKCRKIGGLAQGEVLRVLGELSSSMKSYQESFEESQAVATKLQNEVKAHEAKAKKNPKSLNKKQEKYELAKQKCNRARNEYLLCIDAANAALHKFFGDDLSDLIDCMDIGTDCWLSLLLDNIIAARKAACRAEMNALAQLNEFRENMAPQCDKQRFFESSSSTFMLPKPFEFRSDSAETMNRISLESGLANDLKERHHQMRVRLDALRNESEITWKTLVQTEARIQSLISAQHAIEVSSDGVLDSRPPAEALDGELDTAVNAYTTAFSYYLLNANLIVRLEARADGIAKSLGCYESDARSPAVPKFADQRVPPSPLRNSQISGSLNNGNHSLSASQQRLNHSNDMAPLASITEMNALPPQNLPPNVAPQPPPTPQLSVHSSAGDHQSSGGSGGEALRHLQQNADPANWSNYSAKSSVTSGSTGGQPTASISLNLSSNTQRPAANGTSQPQYAQLIPRNGAPNSRRPRLFGGSLEEYVQQTGEKIPLVVTSCIRALSQFAVHHQGVFRVSGSQVEINHIRDAFEEGFDPLRNRRDGSDANCIAGVLKMYLRELREPLFPFFMFERIVDCAKSGSTDEFIKNITELIRKLPATSYLLLRYLFAFLSYMSEYSDENMMDPYNLAVCFGPTLLRIPDSKDQVYYQNYVNEVIKNLITNHSRVFSSKVAGPVFEPPASVIVPRLSNGGDDEMDTIDRYADEVLCDYFTTAADEPSTAVWAKNLQPNGSDLNNPPVATFCYSSSETSDLGNAAKSNGAEPRTPEKSAELNGAKRSPLVILKSPKHAADDHTLTRETAAKPTDENAKPFLNFVDSDKYQSLKSVTSSPKSEGSIDRSTIERIRIPVAPRLLNGHSNGPTNGVTTTSVSATIYGSYRPHNASTNDSDYLNASQTTALSAQSPSPVLPNPPPPPLSNGYLYSTVQKKGPSAQAAARQQRDDAITQLEELIKQNGLDDRRTASRASGSATTTPTFERRGNLV